VTPDQIIAHRRRRLLELAAELGNVSEACRQMGVSRTRRYEWKRLAEQYGGPTSAPAAIGLRAGPNAHQRLVSPDGGANTYPLAADVIRSSHQAGAWSVMFAMFE
jgi:transposase-like protein